MKQVPHILTESERAIAEEICFLMYADIEEMTGKSNKLRASIPRWLFWMVLYNEGYSLLQCAKVTGHDHTTVLYAFERIEGESSINKQFSRSLKFLTAKYDLKMYDDIRKRGSRNIQESREDRKQRIHSIS